MTISVGIKRKTEEEKGENKGDRGEQVLQGIKKRENLGEKDRKKTDLSDMNY